MAFFECVANNGTGTVDNVVRKYADGETPTVTKLNVNIGDIIVVGYYAISATGATLKSSGEFQRYDRPYVCVYIATSSTVTLSSKYNYAYTVIRK
jgi:5-deoxy-D-glucuronate isomerase